MEFITALWIPILLSAAAVWVISAVFWMAVNHHKHDAKSLGPAAETALKALIKQHAISPGVYGYPNFADCHGKSPEERKAMMHEPMGILRVWGMPGMGKLMLMSVLVYLVIGVLIAYIGHTAFAGRTPAPTFTTLFRVLGTAAILAHCFGGIVNGFWFQESKRAQVLCFIDGVIYGLATGAIFAYFWPT